MAEISSLLNCRTGNSVPRVRIPPSPHKSKFVRKVREVAHEDDASRLGSGESQECESFDLVRKNTVREVAQAGSAPGLGPGGRRFESCLPDKQEASTQVLAFFIV